MSRLLFLLLHIDNIHVSMAFTVWFSLKASFHLCWYPALNHNQQHHIKIPKRQPCRTMPGIRIQVEYFCRKTVKHQAVGRRTTRGLFSLHSASPLWHILWPWSLYWACLVLSAPLFMDHGVVYYKSLGASPSVQPLTKQPASLQQPLWRHVGPRCFISCQGLLQLN